MFIRKILIIDDSPTDRHLLSNILTGDGYQVKIAENGEKGVAMSQAVLPDLIIMAVLLPDLNGFQATRMIIKNKVTQHIPIILCTSKGETSDRVWGMRQGAIDYIVKPVVAAELLQKINQLMTRK